MLTGPRTRALDTVPCITHPAPRFCGDTQVFGDEFHIATLEQFLAACTQLKEKVLCTICAIMHAAFNGRPESRLSS